MIAKILDDKTFVGVTGLLSTIILDQISVVVSILVGLATLGYMVTKWRAEHMEIKRKQKKNF